MSQIYVSPSSLSPIYATIVYPTEKTTKIVSVEKKPWGKCLKLSMILSIMFLTAVIFIAVLSCALIFATPNNKLICTGNASVINNKCVCNYGYNGDGKNYCDECGITFIQPNVAKNSRIVGGLRAIPYSWPSAVLIIFNYKGEIRLPAKHGKDEGEIVLVKLSSKCGGTLIDRTTVLTAGHCFVDTIRFTYNDEPYTAPVKPTKYYKTLASMYTIYAGVYLESETFLGPLLNDSSMIEVVASKLIKHEEYNERTKQNDIALIKLSSPVQLSDQVQLACLPDPMSKSIFPPPGKDCWTVGWGRLTEDGDQPDELYNVKLNTYNGSMCSSVGYGVPKTWNTQLCAGEIEGGKDSCQGDSGGGLFVQDEINKKKKFITAGIVSYGDGCGTINKPGIYTRTFHYLDWIKKNM